MLFAGFALAESAGLLSRNDLLAQLIQLSVERGVIDQVQAERLSRSLEADQSEAVADELDFLVPRERQRELIDELTTRSRPSAAHRLLADLPFEAVLTSGYDTLLAEAFGRPSVPLTDMPSGSRGSLSSERSAATLADDDRVLQLRVTAAGDYILTTRAFRRTLTRNRTVSQYLAAALLTRPHVFLGTNLREVLDYVESFEFAERPSQRHFALVGDNVDDLQLRYLDREFNLQVLALAGGTRALVRFLERLRESVGARGPSRRTQAPPVLDRVRMENIGPYRQLDVPLERRWNVLLGNNGMGKSLVLRAIAATLCGEFADPRECQKLLRTGATRGFVEVHAGSRVYRLELQRDGEGKVERGSVSLPPMRTENWLVLGFPALRTMPTEAPVGPTADVTAPAPSPDDLLPVLMPSPDRRLADIKQWLINLDYRSTSPGAEGRRARRLLDRFFEVLRIVMPDVDLSLGEIDRETHAIRVNTTGGQVPIEAISQGTTAVTGWVGTLLQRLHEVHSRLDSPEAGGALVLIDEIDAHMHPEWQRTLVERLTSLFPTVQFLATTHSPLIVSAMRAKDVLVARHMPVVASRDGVAANIDEAPDGEVQVVVRGDDGDVQVEWLPAGATLMVARGARVCRGEPLTSWKRVELQPLLIEPLGSTADQILTSQAFDLESPRDPETERLIDRYTELAALDEPSDENLAELRSLGEQLGVRIATPIERTRAREAFDVLTNSVHAQLAELPESERRRLVDEIKVQMQESQTGSRRRR